MTPNTRILVALLVALAISGCGVVRFDKAGESDARSACQTMHDVQDSDSIEEGLAALTMATTYADEAAGANDDYQKLASSLHALTDALRSGNETLGELAWENFTTACNDL